MATPYFFIYGFRSKLFLLLLLYLFTYMNWNIMYIWKSTSPTVVMKFFFAFVVLPYAKEGSFFKLFSLLVGTVPFVRHL